jgi:hypothetical protein
VFYFKLLKESKYFQQGFLFLAYVPQQALFEIPNSYPLQSQDNRRIE